SRFSDRVDNYIKYRPGYPVEVLDLLETSCGLTSESLIADIGSGTGISSRLFLDHHNTVYGVEPNQEMRQAAEKLLQKYSHFHSINATAEKTHLPADSFDFIIAGQAFHWFDHEQTRQEFQRIIKPDGWVVLIWNERQIDTSPFLVAYEQLLLNFATDYTQVNHTNLSLQDFDQFFHPHPVQTASLPSQQSFDLESLTGRLLSSSYAPNVGQPGYSEILNRLQEIFHQHQVEGRVAFEYDTNLYYGQIR
ncbi:MAG: class I SAM-dependent methyltransferase, partial [Planctomycetaceae bacterium]|nr:class I SAM-dependent methyltransferase [Planctomycetaceae bacterium]